MTWQHDLIVVDALVSALVAMVIIAVYGGRVTYTPFWGTVNFAWNVALVWLLWAGAQHSAWQYWVLGLAFGWATLTSFARGLKGETVGAATNKPPGIGGAAFIITIITIGQIALVVSGA